MSKLKPCPFCGARAAIQRGAFTKYVMCLGCEVMGPNLSSSEELTYAWNRRSAPDAQRTDAVTPYEILKAFLDAGMNLEPTPNALYTVRGQHAQLIEGVRTLLEAAQDDGVKS